MVRRLRAAWPGGRALGGRTAGPTPRPPGARGGVQPAHRHDLGPEGREGRPDATTFAENLPETAAELYVTDAADDDLTKADRLPRSSIDAEFYGLMADRRVARSRVWSAWLWGDHLVAVRREVLRQFANGIDAAGQRVHRAFLASGRVLGEGVDLTGERGVEAICFADTRGSRVEIVQNIGRAPA